MAKVDDEMLRHYCNEDLFLMEVQHRDADSYDLTLIELTGVEHWASQDPSRRYALHAARSQIRQTHVLILKEGTWTDQPRRSIL